MLPPLPALAIESPTTRLSLLGNPKAWVTLSDVLNAVKLYAEWVTDGDVERIVELALWLRDHHESK